MQELSGSPYYRCIPIGRGTFRQCADIGSGIYRYAGAQGAVRAAGNRFIIVWKYAAKPLLEGGTGSSSRRQEMPDFLPDRLESGTHNIPGIAGLLQGIRYVRKRTPEQIAMHERTLIRALERGLRRWDTVEVFASERETAQVGVLSVRIKERECEEVGAWLADRGIAVRAGLHCAPMAHESAGTLETGTVRFSVSAFNTQAEIQTVLTQVGLLVR